MPIANSNAKKVAIIGASGYGGIQCMKLLNEHPDFDVVYLGGEKSAGKRWSDINPYLPLENEFLIESSNTDKITEIAEYVILSLPNGLASQIVPELISKNIKILDLSADYRYNKLKDWQSIYKEESQLFTRNDQYIFDEAIYGLSEWYHDDISKAKIVSCPGCFPTASLLSILPFLKQGLIETQGIIIDAKTGTSGGGRASKQHLLLSEASEAISAYSVIGHRHTSEIEQITTSISGCPIQLQFTPHLVPMVRGILSTVYGRLRDPGLTAEDCTTLLSTFYKNKPFVEVLPVGIYPSTKWVRNTNKAVLSVQVDKRNGTLIIMCAIDNLIKGQAGQAIQNLNIMCNLEEDKGLPILPFYP